MIPNIVFSILIGAPFCIFYIYVLYVLIVVHNLRSGKWAHGVGGMHIGNMAVNGFQFFYIPMRKSEIEYWGQHLDEWLAEQDNLKWRIRRVRIGWLPDYLVVDPSPEEFCEGILNYFKEDDTNGV